jgi:hypothetical protein
MERVKMEEIPNFEFTKHLKEREERGLYIAC